MKQAFIAPKEDSVLVSCLLTWQKLTSSKKREPQQRQCSYQIGMDGIFFLNNLYRTFQLTEGCANCRHMVLFYIRKQTEQAINQYSSMVYASVHVVGVCLDYPLWWLTTVSLNKPFPPQIYIYMCVCVCVWFYHSNEKICSRPRQRMVPRVGFCWDRPNHNVFRRNSKDGSGKTKTRHSKD